VGRNVVTGVKVAIVGKPNTGKSSILNALLSYDKAIVSSIPGTTRDIVEGSVEIDGVKFNFSDTAGIRESDDEIETLGVVLSKKILDEADLILFVLDSSNIDKTDEEIKELVNGKNVLTVLNKTDKLDRDYDGAELKISAKEKINLDELRSKIFEKTIGKGIDVNGDFLCEERHFDAMTRAKAKIEESLNGIDFVSTDMLAVDVKGAWDALGEISGKTATEEIINNIFSKFCVGK
jgi:tRNA modification GTPase